MNKRGITYAIAIGAIFVTLLIVSIIGNMASIRRSFKSIGSEMNNGLNRTITVYDYNGQEIRHWEGRFDVTESETGILFDDQDGKRTIITGGIVINEEK